MNNFDISSKGESIEFFCYYDYNLPCIYYEEFISEAVRLEFGRNSSVFLLGDAGQPYYKKSELKKMSKQALYDLCNFYDLLGLSLNDYLKSDFIEYLLKVTATQHYQEAISNSNWHSFQDKISHDYFLSHGYSQGDNTYVISLDKPITKKMREDINHILYDSPICIRAEVNGIEFYEDDFLDNCYEYDADAVKEKIKALPISDYAKGWLVDNVPKYPID